MLPYQGIGVQYVSFTHQNDVRHARKIVGIVGFEDGPSSRSW